jgi:predicted small secreted protein
MKKKLPKLYIMKRIMIPVFAIAVAMTACNTTPDNGATQKAIQPTADTTGLAQFQAWKAQNELVSTQQNAAMAQPQTREVVKYYPVSSARRSSSSSSSRSTGTASSGTTTRKKGWSSAAKGAVIGGVAGAAGGAVINKKNRAAGAVIGGVIGAAGGYGIGRSVDKKNGRY